MMLNFTITKSLTLGRNVGILTRPQKIPKKNWTLRRELLRIAPKSRSLFYRVKQPRIVPATLVHKPDLKAEARSRLRLTGESVRHGISMLLASMDVAHWFTILLVSSVCAVYEDSVVQRIGEKHRNQTCRVVVR